MFKICKYLIAIACLAINTVAFADITIQMHETAKEGVGKFVGTVTAIQTQWGVLFMPQLHNLTPGIHGFHVHINPSCADNGMAASGHLDPQNTEEHLGPYDKGHLGDLPVLIVDNQGSSTLPVLAPRLKLTDIKNHALMIHNGGDNYSDAPQKLGGGGGRMVCGVIKG